VRVRGRGPRLPCPACPVQFRRETRRRLPVGLDGVTDWQTLREPRNRSRFADPWVGIRMDLESLSKEEDFEREHTCIMVPKGEAFCSVTTPVLDDSGFFFLPLPPSPAKGFMPTAGSGAGPGSWGSTARVAVGRTDLEFARMKRTRAMQTRRGPQAPAQPTLPLFLQSCPSGKRRSVWPSGKENVAARGNPPSWSNESRSGKGGSEGAGPRATVQSGYKYLDRYL
jgi:hypothetical protein